MGVTPTRGVRLLLIALCLLIPLSTVSQVFAWQAPVNGQPSAGDPYFPTLGNSGYDAQHYDVVLTIDPRKRVLRGTTTVELTPTVDRRNLIRADIGAMATLEIEPAREPTAVFVKPQVGYTVGRPGSQGPGEVVEQNRDEFYATTHPQQIAFEIARQVTACLVGDATSPGAQGSVKVRQQSRHLLFPQVLRLTLAYLDRKVDYRGEDRREIGLNVYVQRVVERLLAAIEPDAAEGEAPLLPILNRYQRFGTSADVDFKTVRPCFQTRRSHVNLVQADTATWEQSAAFRLEQAEETVDFYVRNEGLGFAIPWEDLGVNRHYEPDFIVRMRDGTSLILEIKGHEDNEDRAKYEAARRWVRAVNAWGETGQWSFHVCRDPQVLREQLRSLYPPAVAAD